MQDVVNTGLIGYGNAAKVFHAPVIESVPGLVLKKVIERHKEESSERYPQVEVVRDAETLFLDDHIELVVIATPNDIHFELAEQALKAGKNVIVDKPFTLTSDQAHQLVNLAERKNLMLSVFQNRRWDGDFKTVDKLLKEKLLGRLVEFESHFDRFRNYRKAGWREDEGEGTGILYDLGSHLIDQAQALFGLPEMITADIRMQRESAKVADNFELILHYLDLKVTLKAGMLVREPRVRFTLHGTEGSYVKYGMDPQEDALKQGLLPTTPNWGAEPRENWGNLNTNMNGLHFDGALETLPGSYQDYYRNIVEVLRRREELIVKPEQAMNTIRIIELALKSDEEKRTVRFE
ncbi:MAG: oxidoreductase [Balneolales bacterium]